MKELIALREEVDRKVVVESFGARILLESNSDELLERALERAKKALVGQVLIIEKAEESEVDYWFRIAYDENGEWYLVENGEKSNYGGSEFSFFKFFDSMLRLRVAQNASDRIFVHAGVVGWKGRAVMIPATSMKGKTTLVAELIRNGAQYYSDEYALLDNSGYVHPFPRNLSLRGFEADVPESSIPPEAIGGTVGNEPISVGAVLFTEYQEGAHWDPVEMTIGNAIMETIPHTIPVHSKTKNSLEVLNKAYKGAIIAKSFRGDVKHACPEILAFLDNHLN